jgi:hypothetical protein
MLAAFVMSNGPALEQSLPTIAIAAALSGIPKSVMTLTEMTAVVGDFSKTIYALKSRIPSLIKQSVPNGKFAKYLFYEEDSDLFSIEDPVFRYFLNHLQIEEFLESLGVPTNYRGDIVHIRESSRQKYAPATPAKQKSTKRVTEFFISYSHKDRKWVEMLKIHLKPLTRQLNVSLFSDSSIVPGGNWQQEIQSALSRASVAVLLVSPNFLASDWISSQELPSLLERTSREGLCLVWIPIEDCIWHMTSLAHHQAAWDPSRPLSSLSSAQRDKAWVKIADCIKNAIQRSDK